MKHLNEWSVFNSMTKPYYPPKEVDQPNDYVGKIVDKKISDKIGIIYVKIKNYGIEKFEVSLDKYNKYKIGQTIKVSIEENKFYDWMKSFKNKKEPINNIEPEVAEIEEKEPVVEIPVRWTSSYTYNGEDYMLKIGDYTNKGVITDIIEDIHPSYITPEGSFSPDRLSVLKGEQEDIDAYLDSKKYNL
jgi:hypothetical protein